MPVVCTGQNHDKRLHKSAACPQVNDRYRSTDAALHPDKEPCSVCYGDGLPGDGYSSHDTCPVCGAPLDGTALPDHFTDDCGGVER